MNQTRNWSGYWIRGASDPAPWIRKTFELETIPQSAVAHLCGLGWHELYINGKKADDRVLTPGIGEGKKPSVFLDYILQ